MTLELQHRITAAGLDATIAAHGNGLSAQITHIAFGDAGPAGYTPAGNETALRGERERVPITFSMKDGPGAFRVRGVTPVLDDAADEYWIREVGVFLSDGTLFSVWSDPDRPVTGRGHGAEFEFDFRLMLDALPDGAVEIVVTPGGDRVLTALAAQTAAIAALTTQMVHQAALIQNLRENH